MRQQPGHHTQKDIQCAESVQRRAARFVHKDYSRHTSVTSMLQSLGWPEEKGKLPDNAVLQDPVSPNQH